MLTTPPHIMRIKMLNLLLIEHSSSILFKWLNDNYMKVNTGKSHLLVSGNARSKTKIDNNYIDSEKEQVLLGITIDSNLTFENHINNICKKASQKLNALARVAPYMNTQQIFCNIPVWVLSVNLDVP